ncbi:hypothetical protein N8645_00875 [bacterium]|nr:hypothetical protein [bacterium]
MKVLIHWHPQFSYFFRAFHEAANTLGVSKESIKADIVIGANFLTSINASSIAFLENVKKSNNSSMQIDKIIICPEELSGNQIRSDAVSVSPGFSCSADISSLKVFTNSINDSLARSLFKGFDAYKYRTDSSYRHVTTGLHREYACSLMHFYDYLLSSEDYHLVVISHGNYVYYIALYLAALHRSVRTMVIHGGHGHCYVHRNFTAIDLCPSNMYDELASIVRGNDINMLGLPDEIVSDANNHTINFTKDKNVGSLALPLRDNLQSFRWSHTNGAIMAMVPILLEFQNRNCLEFNYCFSKSSWIERIIQLSADSGQELVFYLHPDISDSNEYKLQTALIDFFSKRHSIFCKVLTSRNEAINLLKEKPVLAASPSGTIASELACIGGKSLITNYCTAARVSSSSIIIDPFSTVLDIEETLYNGKTNVSDLHSDDVVNSLKLYMAFGKYNSKVLLLNTALDRIFFFGSASSKRDFDCSLVSIDDAYSTVRPASLTTENFEIRFGF